jgi:hypothetical protein
MVSPPGVILGESNNWLGYYNSEGFGGRSAGNGQAGGIRLRRKKRNEDSPWKRK